MIHIPKNLGVLDRVLRTGISAILLYLAFIDDKIVTDAYVAGLLAFMGIANLVFVVIGNCPLYTAIGFNTCNSDTKSLRQDDGEHTSY